MKEKRLAKFLKMKEKCKVYKKVDNGETFTLYDKFDFHPSNQDSSLENIFEFDNILDFENMLIDSESVLEHKFISNEIEKRLKKIYLDPNNKFKLAMTIN